MFSKFLRSPKAASVLLICIRRRNTLISKATLAKRRSPNQRRTSNFNFLESGPLFCSSIVAGNELPVLDESEFHEVADETLEELIDCLGKLEDSLDDFEVDLSVSISKVSQMFRHFAI